MRTRAVVIGSVAAGTLALGLAGVVGLPPGEGTASYPMTLQSGWGETVLRKRPERIAVIA